MQKKDSSKLDSVLNPFMQKHQSDVIGVLRGFDRLRLAGTFRALYHPPVMEKYIQKAGFLLKDFKQLMLQVTCQIKTAELYPHLVHHGIKSFGSRDVLRFLGYKPPINGVGKFVGELNSSLKRRAEGLRVKHFVNGNSIKLSDQPRIVF